MRVRPPIAKRPEKRNANARARRAALSTLNAQRLAISQKQKKGNREQREVSRISPAQQRQAADKKAGLINAQITVPAPE